MNLDKDDLFRNAAPGFVFVLVILSFYAVIGQINVFDRPIFSILTIVAAFPIGFIIQSSHRIIFHFWFREREKMQKEEFGMHDPNTRAEILQRCQNVNTGSDAEKIAQWTAFCLDHEKNKHFTTRINFLNTYFHALGASAWAIFLALAYLVIMKSCQSGCSFGQIYTCFFLPIVATWTYLKSALIIGWVLMAGIFYSGRQNMKREYDICRKIFIRTGQLSLAEDNPRAGS